MRKDSGCLLEQGGDPFLLSGATSRLNEMSSDFLAHRCKGLLAGRFNRDAMDDVKTDRRLDDP